MQTVVRLEGVVEKILERLVDAGYYKTKSEAIRAGILELGKEYSLVGNEAEFVIKRIRGMEREVATGKKKLVPLSEVMREASSKK